MLDTIVGGITSISTTGGGNVLSAAQLANGLISVSGALVSAASINFPSVQGWWSVNNATTGNFPLFIAAGAGSQLICALPGEVTDIQVAGGAVLYRNLGRVGSYLDYAGTSVPSWVTNCSIPPYLLCDGSTFSAGQYPVLNSILGGTTLPDLRGRARFYLNGGTNRITSAVSGINGDVVLSAGGNQNAQAHNHTITTGGMNSNQTHTHSTDAINSPTSIGSGPSSPGSWQAGGVATINVANIDHTHSGTTSTFGSGASQNMPPATISGITMIRAG